MDICHEIDTWYERMGPISVPTIFFGGGTPSLMPVSCLDQILSHIARKFAIAPNAEITVESNPGTMDAIKLHDFIYAGMNRLSVGVQSFHDKELTFLGRRHTAHDARHLIDVATNAGLRVSADFIYGLPGHGVKNIIDLCQDINQMGLRHCSLYELTIEPSTPMGKMKLDMPDNDLMADMYNAIDASLNLNRYEVSNYAAPSQECRHNAGIWAGDAYIGLGRGAAGRPLINGVWHDQMGAGARCTPIDHATRAVEKVLTGMRTMRGIALTPDIRDVIDHDALGNALENGTISMSDPNHIAPTAKGMLILDNLMINLMR